MKTVSVVMCTYNGEKYIREQIDSILNQSYPIYELIIQDDCSTDGTVNIINEYVNKFSNVQLYINEKNLGFNKNFESVAMKAHGDFVAISDQDDVWFPKKIEKQVRAIGEHDICCSLYVRGECLDEANILQMKFCFERQLFSSILGHTMLCRRSFIQKKENWLPSIWYDWSLALHGYLNNGVVAVNEPLNWHREHSGEISKSFCHEKKTNIISPYIFGYSKYRKWQQNANWRLIYSYLYKHTSEQHSLVHTICSLLLKEDFVSLVRLCCICLKYREKIYPSKPNGIIGMIRAFFYPMLHGFFIENLYVDWSNKSYTITNT